MGELTITELSNEIVNQYRSSYPKHYKAHTEGSETHTRAMIANGLSTELHRRFIELQFPEDKTVKPIKMQPKSTLTALERLTDYILAEDLNAGIKRRNITEQPKTSDEYPPLGEGAIEYLKIYGAKLPDCLAERKRVKRCEICDSNFIDKSQSNRSKVCGPQCRKKKDALRNRESYNEEELGLIGENRLKRDRTKQQFDYTFYSRYEMWEVNNFNEISYDHEKLDYKAVENDDRYEEFRLNGKRKPMYVGRDEFSEKPFNYRPKGKDEKYTDADIERKVGKVTVRYNVSAEQLEAEKFVNADKMKGLYRFTQKAKKESCTSEISA